MDTLIKELVQDLLSFVQDTRDVLLNLENFIFPPQALQVVIDVESLYTSIPHQWGLRAVYHFLESKFPLLASQNEFIVDILKFMLEHNCFQFLGVNYRHIRDTRMGAPWAPSYACLHLGLWERDLVYSSSMYLGHCLLWLRYIDNMYMVWGGTPQDLTLFINELNDNERNIRLLDNAQPLHDSDVGSRLRKAGT